MADAHTWYTHHQSHILQPHWHPPTHTTSSWPLWSIGYWSGLVAASVSCCGHLVAMVLWMLPQSFCCHGHFVAVFVMFPLSLHCHGNSLLLCYHTHLLQLFALPVVASCHGCSCGHCVTVVVHSCNSCMAMVDCSPNHCMAAVNSLPSRSLHCHGHLLLWSLLALLVPMFTLAVFILLQSFVLTVMRCHSLFALAVIALLQLLALVIIALLWSFAPTITTLPQSFALTIITLHCHSHLLSWLLQSFHRFILCWHHFGAREALEHLLIVWLLIVSHQILEMIIILSWMMSLVIHCQSLSIKSQKEVEQMF